MPKILDPETFIAKATDAPQILGPDNLPSTGCRRCLEVHPKLCWSCAPPTAGASEEEASIDAAARAEVEQEMFAAGLIEDPSLDGGLLG